MNLNKSLPSPIPWNPHASLHGALHIFVAFDWGSHIDLEQVRQRTAAQVHLLPRRRRTPASIAYRPSPVRLQLQPMEIEVNLLGRVRATAEMTLFDFGAVSVALHLPWQLSASDVPILASGLADSAPLVDAVRRAVDPLHNLLEPAIADFDWGEQTEEYFVFEIPPGPPLAAPHQLMDQAADWIAAIVRLEQDPLSPTEIVEALRQRISYTPSDLFVAEWSAALLIDHDCEETLETIELANLQLLELRHLDTRLDDQLANAHRLIRPLKSTWLPFWRTHARQLRALGDLKVQANTAFERAGNVLKLVGDQYLSRVYRLLAARFHLDTWEASVRNSLDTAESVYRVVSDQSATLRAETLEIIIVGLILFEVALSLYDRL
jgi:hypothetical protein